MGIEITSKNPIDIFINGLLASAKLEELPAEYKAEYRMRLAGQFLERLGLVALAALPQSDVARAQELTEKEDNEGLMQLFQKNIPQFESLLQKTFTDFRQQFLDSIANARTSNN